MTNHLSTQSRDVSQMGLSQALAKRAMWNQMRMNPTDLADTRLPPIPTSLRDLQHPFHATPASDTGLRSERLQQDGRGARHW